MEYYSQKIINSSILENLDLKEGEYFLISSHKKKISSNENFEKFISFSALEERYNLQIIVSTHPRTKSKSDSENVKITKNVRLLKPLGFFDYNKLQISSKAVLSDSGTISEESSILNFRALNIRDSHERPEAMEEAAVMMVGLNITRVMQTLEIIENGLGNKRELKIVNDYKPDNVSWW